MDLMTIELAVAFVLGVWLGVILVLIVSEATQ